MIFATNTTKVHKLCKNEVTFGFLLRLVGKLTFAPTEVISESQVSVSCTESLNLTLQTKCYKLHEYNWFPIKHQKSNFQCAHKMNISNILCSNCPDYKSWIPSLKIISTHHLFPDCIRQRIVSYMGGWG